MINTTHMQSKMVMCECRQPVSPDHTPPEIQPASGEIPWKIILLPQESQISFLINFASYYKRKARLWMMSGLFSPRIPFNEVHLIVSSEQLEIYLRKPWDQAVILMLTFSGTIPTPPGEENLEHLLAQAHLMVEKCVAVPTKKNAQG